MNALVPHWKNLIALGLEEDSVAFDWTARATQNTQASQSQKNTTAQLIAKSEGIWAGDAGLKALEILSTERGAPIRIKSYVRDGDSLKPQQKICEWVGNTDAIVTFERTFINLTAYTCGIATQTQKFIQAAKTRKLKNPPRITATRKTLPGYRAIAIQSTLVGGAHPHRYNLSGGLLLKENHIAAAGGSEKNGIEKAIVYARSVIPHLLKIEIEVRNLTELKKAIDAGAEVIMLDNFSPKLIKEAIKLKPKSALIYEVSGGITLSNLTSYLHEGIDVISIGSLTHSVLSVDLSLLIP